MNLILILMLLIVALNVIEVRARHMQKASQANASGLMTVFTTHSSELSLALKASKEWCSTKLRLEGHIDCAVANYLNADCRVIGGNVEVRFCFFFFDFKIEVFKKYGFFVCL